MLCLDADALETGDGSNPSVVRHPAHLAYVIYTSGSTGQPKGVMIAHGALSNYLHWAVAAYMPDAGSVVSSSLSFDATVTSLWLPLLRGSAVTLLREGEELEGLEAHVSRQGGLVKITPAHLDALGQRLESAGVQPGVDLFVVGGEALNTATVKRWLALQPGVRIVNEYGPTETVVGCMLYEAASGDVASASAPIGKPIANTAIYILDGRGEPVPVGVTGEIYIAGAGLARGYLNRAALSAERFVPNPFGEPGSRMYRTGDVARYRADGEIEYLGRNDEQVKLRGFRIELGEIGAALGACEGVDEAVVLMRGEGGDRRLVGYYTGAEALDPAALREALLGRLPEYMVPSAFVHVGAWPLTPNGKLERRALPDPEREAFGSVGYEAPRGETEETLAAIWAELLKQPKVGRHDNFFELGGNSLLAIKLLARMRRAGLKSDARTLFGAPTPALLAATLGASSQTEPASPAVPANGIVAGSTAITPAMLPLVTLTQAQIDGLVAATPGGAANIQDIYPLAPLQEGVLFHHLMARGAGRDPFVLGALFAAPGRERLDAFVAALQQVVARHDILRTAVHWQGLPEPVQVVLRDAPVPVEELRVGPPDGDIAAQLEASLAQGQVRIEIDQAPLLRVAITHDAARERWLMRVVFHHLIADHTGMDIVRAEIRALQAGEAGRLGTPVPFRNYVAQTRLGVSRDEHEAFFRTMLAEVDEPTLPFGLRDVHGDGHDVGEAVLALDEALAARLRTQARRLGVGAASLFHLAWARVVGVASGRDDVVFGTVLFGRLQGGAQAEHALGMFINTLPVRVRLAGGVADGVARVHALLTALLRHEHASLALAQQCSGVPAPAPLFSALLNYRHSDAAPEVQTLDGIETLGAGERTNYPLVMSVDDLGEGFRLTAQAAGIDPARVCASLYAALSELAAALEQAPARPIVSLAVLDTADRQAMQAWNRTASAYPREARLDQLFSAQAARTPEALAVIDGEITLAYAELERRANRLAHYLLGRGVGTGGRVALRLDRSLDLVVAELAVLKCGAAYVPLDGALPEARQRLILDDCGASLVLAHARDRLPADLAAARIDLDTLALDALPAGQPDLTGSALAPAYVMYTSGSTGVPKGVLVPHRAVSRLVLGAGYVRIEAGDRVAFASNPAFDASTFELWAPLLNGGCVVLVSPADLLAPSRFAGVLRGQRIRTLWLTAGLFNQMADALSAEFAALRDLIVGGEALDPVVIARVLRNGAPQRLLNGYGPTEATTFSLTHEIRAAETGRAIPVGRPIGNTSAWLLDTRGDPVPVGVPGELHVGGDGLALGYLNRAGLSAERFVPNPFGEPGSRLYRTGDVARYRADGEIEYLGRNDEQVKLRGFRIELGEIGAALGACEGVDEAVVLMRGEGGDRRLVAYYRAADIRDAALLREALLGRLPEYMVPSAFVHVGAWPLTPNGKLERRALPDPEREAFGSVGYEAPQGETEETLAAIWAELLKQPRVGRHDNFFELGGHSLLAIQLLERMRLAGLHTDVRALFAAPTLAGLATAVGDESAAVTVPPNGITADTTAITPAMLPLASLSQAEIDQLLARIPGGGANVQDIYPLAPLQEGVLFHHLMAGDRDPYVLDTSFRIEGRARLDAFVEALQQVIARHDILRTCVHWEGLSQPVQLVQRRARLRVDEIEGGTDVDDRLDVREAPLLRAAVVAEEGDRWLMRIRYHHLVMDHTALEVIQHEVQALLAGQASRLAAPVPFRNYVAQARLGVSRAEHEAFFREQLGDVEEPTLPFGLDAVHGERDGLGDAHHELDAKLGEQLREHARRLGVSAASLFHLAWAQVVGRASGRDDVVFGTVLFGRLQGGAGVDRALGMFINTLPVRIDLAQAPAEALARTHQALMRLLRHEHAPLALAQQCSGVAAPAPLFSALLNYRHSRRDGGAAVIAGIEPLGASESTNYPLVLSVDDFADGFRLMVQVQGGQDAARIGAYVGEALARLNDALARHEPRPVRDLPIVPAAERARLVAAAGGEARVYPVDQALHRRFEAQAADTPDAIALVAGEASLSYAELNRRANRLAHHLAALGVGAESRVAICVERGFGMLVGVLGILKAGAAYVPIDPGYPAERVTWMLDDCRPAALLVDAAARERLGARAMPVVDLDDPAWPGTVAEHDPAVPVRPEQAAYLIYTSGSTGRPKGVVIEHRQVARLFAAARERFSFGPDDVWTLFHSFAFDFSVWEIWGALLHGGRLVIVPLEVAQTPQAFHTLLCDSGTTILSQTPGAFRQLIAAQAASDRRHALRQVVFGGEALEMHMLAPWHADARNGATRLVNMYGITETTVHVTWRVLAATEAAAPGASPIGLPLADLRLYLLDSAGEPVPQGVPGEIHVGGAGLARGYFDRPGLSAERFVPDSFGPPGGRLYRTGDLGRIGADGGIEYLGRNDAQLKIRGFRIETGEIAARLAGWPGIDDAVVVARDTDAGGPQLIGYYLSAQPHDAVQLRAHLAASLPVYMLPSAYVRLDALPLTANGKLDRRALPVPDDEAYARRAYAEPIGEAETRIAAIWSELLEVERVGRDDNFFELGGNSLLAITLIERMRQASLYSNVRTLFGTATLAEFAAARDAAEPAAVEVPRNGIPAAPTGKPKPASRSNTKLRI
ncbi:non-ribosomal peptide synthetase [Burkholderia gladioli]|uniref:non-ribosomal peptide synthetase n=8 Tax=Burkholderia gladioli TaxID=28095 RepID=UPI001ABA238E|nr:non-ribosomal peptide synthetase [Burkholderia gladioli]